MLLFIVTQQVRFFRRFSFWTYRSTAGPVGPTRPKIKISCLSIKAMSSVGKSFAQPLTRNFGVMHSVDFFSQRDVNDWLAANASVITVLGSLVLINGTSAGTTLNDVVLGNGSATELLNSNSDIVSRRTIKDMGKELLIGTTAQPRTLVLRQVQQNSASPASPNGDGLNPNYNGYIVVENNSSVLQTNARFNVSVARL